MARKEELLYLVLCSPQGLDPISQLRFESRRTRDVISGSSRREYETACLAHSRRVQTKTRLQVSPALGL